MTTESIAAVVLAYATVALLIFFYGEALWYAIVFFMDWALRQINRPFDWLFRRYWP